MKINNKNRIRSLRASITEIIRVLESPLTLPDEFVVDDGENSKKKRHSGADIKSSVKVKKNAFVRAKNLLSKLQVIESEEARNENTDWYKDTLTSLISAAESAMDELTSVMRHKIDTHEESSTINSAIDAKQEAHDYVDEIFTGVLELQGVLQGIEDGNGVKMLNTADFKVGFAEDHAYYGFYAQKDRKIQPGYNKNLDAVVISYDGTVGEIIDCYGLRIALPKPPAKAAFPNNRKKKELQFWERPTLPEGLSYSTSHLFLDEIEEEFRRRDEGYWFMNNGEPEYITGSHYMLLTHYKADAEVGTYFHFRKAHRDLFYFLEAAWVDSRSLGVMLGKTRRTGATHVADAFELTKAISTRGGLFGLTSKKNIDAQRAFEKLSMMFKEMPFFFKPLNTGEGLKKGLYFQTPSKRTTKNTQGKETQYDDLGTILDYESTSEDSYDGSALRLYIGDEFSKWPENENIEEHWRKVRKTLLSGGIIRGKAFLLSTVEGVTGERADSDKAKNGDRFKQLYYDSAISTRNPETGRTISGMYKIFISSLDNYGGFIDRYGNCISRTPSSPVIGVNGETITIGVYEDRMNEWASLKDKPSKLNDAKRLDPIVEEDMFRIASEDSLFNIGNIQDQIDYNEKVYLETGSRGYKIGNFRYTDTSQDIVEFYEVPNGRFQISWLPPEEMANAYTTIRGQRAPKFDFVGCFGIDPYKVNKVKYGTGSKGSIIGYLGEHPIEGLPKENFFCVYIGRPQSLDIFFEDAIMCLKYYSMTALIENNINELMKVMHRRGLTRYSMRRPDKLKLSPDELMYGGIPASDTALLNTQAAFLQKHIENHIGYAHDDKYRELGSMGDCPFNDLLSDWARFDILDRTEYDATVASCLAIYGMQKFILKNIKNRKDNSKLTIADIYNFV